MESTQLSALVYLPFPCLVRIRGVCKDLEVDCLRLRRHVAATALAVSLERVGLDLEFARMLEPADTLDVWKVLAEDVFERPSERLYDLSRRRDPFLRRPWVARRRSMWYLLG